MKEFLIFIGVFTVCYIAFWAIYDKLSVIILKNKVKNRAFSLINYDSYLSFAQFYGINGTANLSTLQNIYLNYKDDEKIVLASASQQFGVTPIEFAVIYLYFEYINVFYKKMINLETGVISSMTFDDLSMINKYQTFFQTKTDYQKLFSIFGDAAHQNLTYIDHNFLVPGVRFINDILYYFEGVNKES